MKGTFSNGTVHSRYHWIVAIPTSKKRLTERRTKLYLKINYCQTKERHFEEYDSNPETGSFDT